MAGPVPREKSGPTRGGGADAPALSCCRNAELLLLPLAVVASPWARDRFKAGDSRNMARWGEHMGSAGDSAAGLSRDRFARSGPALIALLSWLCPVGAEGAGAEWPQSSLWGRTERLRLQKPLQNSLGRLLNYSSEEMRTGIST